MPTRLVEEHFPSQIDIGEFLARQGSVRATYTGLDDLTDEQCVVSSRVRGDEAAIERGQGILQQRHPRTTDLQRKRRQVIWPPCLGRVKIVFHWLIDKTQVLYFSSRFLILKNKTSLAALFILLL